MTQPATRRSAILDVALRTFAEHGYRKASMESVARSAEVSRPGLYFLFSSKEELFRAAVTRMLTEDLEAVERALDDRARPLADRLLNAFDHWAGRYVGPAGRAVTVLVEDNPGLAGPLGASAPRRFARLVTAALSEGRSGPGARRAREIAETLLSTSVGLKHRVDTRPAYRRGMRMAIGLLVGTEARRQ